MIPRSAARQAIRLQSSSLASSSRLPIRHLSTNLHRPSRVALGKLPAISLNSTPIRHISWTPWKKDIPTVNSTPVETPFIQPTSTPLPAEVEIAPSSAPLPQIDPTTAASVPTPSSSFTPDPPTVDASPLNTATPVDGSSAVDLASAGPDVAGLTNIIPPGPGGTLADLVNLNPTTPLEELLRTSEAIAAIATRHDLPSIGLDHSMFSPIGWVTDALVSLNSITGLPWWATIALTTAFIRLCVFRIIIQLQSHNQRMAAVAPQMQALSTGLQAAQKAGDQASMQLHKEALQNLMAKHDVNPFRMMKVPAVQMPIFISMFYGLRRLAETPLPGFLEGGLGWVTDLTLADPYYILPITSIVFTNIVIRVGADGTGAATSTNELSRHFKNILAVISIPSFFFISSFPSAVLFYWTTSSFFTLIQAWLLKQSFFKRLFSIPTPAPVAPPPGGIPAEPSFGDTWRYARGFFMDQYAAKRDAQIKAVAAQDRKAIAEGRKVGTERMVKEVVREKKRK